MGFYKDQEDMFNQRAEKAGKKASEYLERARNTDNLKTHDINIEKANKYIDLEIENQKKAEEHKGKTFDKKKK